MVTKLLDRFGDRFLPRHHVKRVLIPVFGFLIVDGLVQGQNWVVVARIGAVVDSFGTATKVGTGAVNDRTWIASVAAHGKRIEDESPTGCRRQDAAWIGDAGGQLSDTAVGRRDGVGHFERRS